MNLRHTDVDRQVFDEGRIKRATVLGRRDQQRKVHGYAVVVGILVEDLSADTHSNDGDEAVIQASDGDAKRTAAAVQVRRILVVGQAVHGMECTNCEEIAELAAVTSIPGPS